jgi:hypothetical protein
MVPTSYILLLSENMYTIIIRVKNIYPKNTIWITVFIAKLTLETKH